MTTIRDIVKAAGVSLGTVSNYLNDPNTVSDATRAKLARIIEELDYHPKAAARSLKSKLTRRIGLVPLISSHDNRSADPGDNAFLELLAGLNTVAGENGFDILISAATNPVGELKTYQRLVGEGQVDGLVITGIREKDNRLKFLHSKKFPFIAYGRPDSMTDIPYVDVDGALGMINAITYLVSLGHKKIAYIMPPAGLMCTHQRWEGFIQGMQNHKLPMRDEYIISGDFSESSGFMLGNRMLELADPPTAILTSNDICAFGVMRAVQRRNLIPGKDVSVIGFDDIALARHWQPALTTISQPFRTIGFSLMQSLLSIVANETANPQVMLEPQLIVRQSSGAPR
jgi:DNA-binding LacI/PurR family transcriptional regulator